MKHKPGLFLPAKLVAEGVPIPVGWVRDPTRDGWMKPLPHVITDDDFFFATEEQRREWNARMAAGTEPQDLTKTAQLNLPGPTELQLWFESCKEQRQRDLEEDAEADKRRASWGE